MDNHKKQEHKSDADPFYSAGNQAYLVETIKVYETGKSQPIVKSMDELERLTE